MSRDILPPILNAAEMIDDITNHWQELTNEKKASYANLIAKFRNLTRPEGSKALEVLYDHVTYTPIPDFPADVDTFWNMSEEDVNRILLSVGAELVGDAIARRGRLSLIIGTRRVTG
ncbi:uncharacterized protein K460DRAFT_406633 [Cucurbitaria berberidis CBS 394.84]|uniref:Uncharacterized protein n=1 Tax=Cucurbitaria berberidis CBS 394.84 TaxID=1168544 RepID=A0A9P4L9H1_9PLEO|nr:uncharacterized protein K460DRAFT_406633 [Cucurbitaria berberidis CBS 394.84]KAF1846428.1 hypothetical protein K460DRAFT_406633 [Cucurbitaria berberidis CBS 394.84]